MFYVNFRLTALQFIHTNKLCNVPNCHRNHVVPLNVFRPIRIYCNVYCIRFHCPSHVDGCTINPYLIDLLSCSPMIPANYVKEYFSFCSEHPSYRAAMNWSFLHQIRGHSMNYQLDLNQLANKNFFLNSNPNPIKLQTWTKNYSYQD